MDIIPSTPHPSARIRHDERAGTGNSGKKKIAPDLARGMVSYNAYLARGEELGTIAKAYKHKWDNLLAILESNREAILYEAAERAVNEWFLNASIDHNEETLRAAILNQP